MKPNPKFSRMDQSFWANIRAISEAIGYTDRRTKEIYAYEKEHVEKTIKKFKLERAKYFNQDNSPTKLTQDIYEYSKHRADELNNVVQHNLQDVDAARAMYESLIKNYDPKCPIPMNKQKEEKKAPAYLTASINILIEQNIGESPCDYDPGNLTKIFDKDGNLTHTLSRRVDGAYPSTLSPKAIWEIKEYYYTTTFGSRVADGVYETQLDGYELEEVFDEKGIKVYHYLFTDAHFTWWVKGRSYLCRIIDMLHMGKLDEAIFGKEILEAVPRIVKDWKK